MNTQTLKLLFEYIDAHRERPAEGGWAMSDDAKAGSLDVLVRLSSTSVQCLRRSVELIERITPGNCSHHAGNIRVMLKAVLEEVEGGGRDVSRRMEAEDALLSICPETRDP